jgi:hypothetical protein
MTGEKENKRKARLNTMSKAIELLPCPFCGAEAQFRRFGVGNDLLMIECANPYGACCRMSIAYTTESERMLADRWNRRTKPMSDELRKAIDEIFEEGESEKT